MADSQISHFSNFSLTRDPGRKSTHETTHETTHSDATGSVRVRLVEPARALHRRATFSGTNFETITNNSCIKLYHCINCIDCNKSQDPCNACKHHGHHRTLECCGCTCGKEIKRAARVWLRNCWNSRPVVVQELLEL